MNYYREYYETILKMKSIGIDALVDTYKLRCKKYPEHNIAILNYHQIDSPKYNPITLECRGLVVDYENYQVLCKPFNRFFNVNEWEDDNFDYDNIIRIEEKHDGSLVNVYYHNGEWHVATRGNAFAEGYAYDTYTFSDLFHMAVGCDINDFMRGRSLDITYSFELCSKYNRVIRSYGDPTIYLIGGHITKTNDVLYPDSLDIIAKDLGVERPKSYFFSDIEEIRKHFSSLDPTEEGYVLIDNNLNRVKIKNPAYVDLHHLKNNGVLTPKRISEIVFRGETEEVLSYFPEFADNFKEYQDAYDWFKKNCMYVWNCLKDKEMTQKEFAIEAKKYPFATVLFNLRKGLTIDDICDRMTSNGKTNLLQTIIKRRKEK